MKGSTILHGGDVKTSLFGAFGAPALDVVGASTVQRAAVHWHDGAADGRP